MGDHIRIYDGRVEKFVGNDVRQVAEKYEAVHKISLAAGFLAPRVLSYDEAKGLLVLEYIENLTSIREPVMGFMTGRLEERRCLAAMQRVGSVLASLHLGLSAPGSHRWVPPATFTASLREYGYVPESFDLLPWAQIHGDFGFSNIHFRGEPPDLGEIAIIDPCAEGYSSEHTWLLGPVYLDVGKFMLSLEGLLPMRGQFALDPRKVAQLQVAFLRGYGSGMSFPVDEEAGAAFAYALGKLYLRHAYPRSHRLAFGVLYNRWWKGNFPLCRKRQALRHATLLT